MMKKYSAYDIIIEQNTRLKAKSWKPLEKDWINPGVPTSYARGRGSYIDGTTKPEAEVHTPFFEDQ
jgi:hypothetical protein